MSNGSIILNDVTEKCEKGDEEAYRCVGLIRNASTTALFGI